MKTSRIIAVGSKLKIRVFLIIIYLKKP